MLPQYLKFHALNNTGQTIDFSTNSANEAFTAKGRFWKFDSSGAIVWSSEVTLITAATDLVDGSNEEAAEYDNSVNLYSGFVGYMELKTDNTLVAGDFQLMMEWPTNGVAGTYPSDAAGFDPDVHLEHIGTINIRTNTTIAVNIQW